MATYGEFRGPTYGDLGETATAAYGEFGVIVVPPSRGTLVLSELTASLRAADALVEVLTDAETLRSRLVAGETRRATLAPSESQGSQLVISEV